MVIRSSSMKAKTEAQNDLWKFCDLIRFFGGCKSFGQIHREVCEYLDEGNGEGPQEKMILMPRSHLKSTVGTCLKVLHEIYRNPDVRVCINTHDLSLAAGFIRVIRQYLEDETLQKEVWNARPHIKGTLVPMMSKFGQRASRAATESEDKKIIWNSQAIQVIRPTVMKEPTVSITSPNSDSTGDHFDIIILDDVATWENQSTPEKRARVDGQIKELRSVLDPYIPETKLGGVLLWLGTRKHREDIYAKQFKRGHHSLFFRNVFKNGQNWQEGSLWPEKRTQQYLEELKTEFFNDADSKTWYSEYLNTIIDNENAVIKSDSFKYAPNNEILFNSSSTIIVTDQGNSYVRPTLAVDWAFTDNKKSDFCALAVAAREPLYGTVFALDAVIEKHIPSAFFPIIWAHALKWKVGLIVVETNKAYKVVAEFKSWLLKQTEYLLNPIPVIEVEQKGEKFNRILQRLAPLYSLNLVEGGKPAIVHREALRGTLLETQLLDLGTTKDDGPDALELAVANLRTFGQGRQPVDADQLLLLFNQSQRENTPMQNLIGGTGRNG
jgi:hypothetical protein